MTKSQIKAELRQIAIEEKFPIGHMVLNNRKCFEKLVSFKKREQNIFRMRKLHLRIFMLFVSEAL